LKNTKYIEQSPSAENCSAAHKAAITGDMVGNPFKDTADLALNILIKLYGDRGKLSLPSCLSESNIFLDAKPIS